MAHHFAHSSLFHSFPDVYWQYRRVSANNSDNPKEWLSLYRNKMHTDEYKIILCESLSEGVYNTAIKQIYTMMVNLRFTV